jgi:polysaccharide biosynthesis transport protein
MPTATTAEITKPADKAEAQLSPLRIAWRQKWLLLGCMAVGLSVGYGIFTQILPIYQSSARVMVSRKETSLPVRGLDGVATTRDQVETQILLITSPLVIERACRKYHLANLRSFADHGITDPTGVIISNLAVKRVSVAAEMIDLSYRSPDPDDAATVVTAVVDSYRDFLGELDQNVSKEALKLIGEAKDSLLGQLQTKETAYRTFRSTSPLLWNAEASANLHNSRLLQIENERSRLMVEATMMQGQINAISDIIARGGDLEGLAGMIGRIVDARAGSQSPAGDMLGLHNELLPLLVEEQILAEKFGPEHPDVKLIRKKVEITRQLLENQKAELLAAPMTAEITTEGVKKFVESLKYELESVKAKQANLTALFDTERELAKHVAEFEARDASLRSDIERTKQLFQTVVNRLDEISLVKDNGGGNDAQVISAAGRGVQVVPNFIKSLLLGAAVGLMLGGGLAWYVETLDRSYQSAEQIRADLGCAILGHIPIIDKKLQSRGKPESSLQPVLITYHQPGSSVSEAYRAVRTAVLFGMRSREGQVLQVTSPSPGDGKSTTCANLALAIALTGKRVLIIDADLRRPQMHRLFGVNVSIGLSSLIQGTAEPSDAIAATEIDNLYVLPAGPRVKNPSELLSSPCLANLVGALKGQFDFILVDSPPLLAVTDPSIIVSFVDHVIMALRITKDGRQSAPMAYEILRQLNADVLGIVVNGVDSFAGDDYRYGATYGYGYGRAYGKRKRPHVRYGSYYAAPAPEESAAVVGDQNGTADRPADRALGA